MVGKDNDAAEKRAYAAPTMRAITPTEMVRMLFAALPAPIRTREDAAAVIRAALEQLPTEERDEALKLALGDNGRWVLQAAWSQTMRAADVKR